VHRNTTTEVGCWSPQAKQKPQFWKPAQLISQRGRGLMGKPDHALTDRHGVNVWESKNQIGTRLCKLHVALFVPFALGTLPVVEADLVGHLLSPLVNFYLTNAARVHDLHLVSDTWPVSLPLRR